MFNILNFLKSAYENETNFFCKEQVHTNKAFVFCEKYLLWTCLPTCHKNANHFEWGVVTRQGKALSKFYFALTSESLQYIRNADVVTEGKILLQCGEPRPNRGMCIIENRVNVKEAFINRQSSVKIAFSNFTPHFIPW